MTLANVCGLALGGERLVQGECRGAQDLGYNYRDLHLGMMHSYGCALA